MCGVVKSVIFIIFFFSSNQLIAARTPQNSIRIKTKTKSMRLLWNAYKLSFHGPNNRIIFVKNECNHKIINGFVHTFVANFKEISHIATGPGAEIEINDQKYNILMESKFGIFINDLDNYLTHMKIEESYKCNI
jgi:hypothetical protein